MQYQSVPDDDPYVQRHRRLSALADELKAYGTSAAAKGTRRLAPQAAEAAGSLAVSSVPMTGRDSGPPAISHTLSPGVVVEFQGSRDVLLERKDSGSSPGWWVDLDARRGYSDRSLDRYLAEGRARIVAHWETDEDVVDVLDAFAEPELEVEAESELEVEAPGLAVVKVYTDHIQQQAARITMLEAELAAMRSQLQEATHAKATLRRRLARVLNVVGHHHDQLGEVLKAMSCAAPDEVDNVQGEG